MTAFFSYIQVIFILLFLQTFFFRNLYLGPWFVPFPYVYFFCILPPLFNKNAGLFVGFFGGLLMDVFYNTTAVHAMACCTVMFFRPYVLKQFSPRDGFYEYSRVHPDFMGNSSYWFYLFVLFFIHHFVLFFLEWFRWDITWLVILRGITSAFISLFFVFSLQKIFSHRVEL